MKGRKNEKGEVMIESLLVYVVTLALLFLILALTFVMYQRLTVNTIANDTAFKVAQSFRFGNDDLSDTSYTQDDLEDMDPYRYLFKFSQLRSSAEEAVSGFAIKRLTRSSFAKSINESNVDVQFDIVSDGIGRRHVVVSIDGSYELPINEIFDYFGLDSYSSYTVYGYAECMDIISYVNDVAFAKTIASTIVKDLGGFGSLAESALTLVNRAISAISQFMGS